MTSKRISKVPTVLDIEAGTLPIGMNTPTKDPKSQLRQAVKDLTPGNFSKDTKDERLTMRVSVRDLDSMKAVADSLGLSVADYLVQLHQAVAERLRKH